MALLQRNFSKIQSLGSTITRNQIDYRWFSRASKTTKSSDIKKSVFISQSNDIYTNIALENWLYKNLDFENHHVLLVYFNESSVLIGNHQNPWIETNVSALTDITDNGTQLVRRFGGGSAMYNDKGILNMSFFTPRKRYDHGYNMEIISRALFRKFNIATEMSSNKNLTINNIDMTAFSSKIGERNSYLNCSVLIDANKINLMDALFRDDANIQTKAIASKKSRYLNLNEIDPNINVNNVLSAIGWEYMRTLPFNLKDGGMELASKQKGFQMVNPTDEWFPGLSEIRDNISNWSWCFGRTPDFTVSRNYPVTTKSTYSSEGLLSDLRVTLTIKNGIVDDVTLFIAPNMSVNGFSGEAKVITTLKGRKYGDNMLDLLEKHLALSHVDHVTDKHNDCIRHAVLSA